MTCNVNPAQMPANALNVAVIKGDSLLRTLGAVTRKPFKRGFVEITYQPSEGRTNALIERVEAAGYDIHDVEWPPIGEQSSALLGLYVTYKGADKATRADQLIIDLETQLIREDGVLDVALIPETRSRADSRL